LGHLSKEKKRKLVKVRHSKFNDVVLIKL